MIPIRFERGIPTRTGRAQFDRCGRRSRRRSKDPPPLTSIARAVLPTLRSPETLLASVLLWLSARRRKPSATAQRAGRPDPAFARGSCASQPIIDGLLRFALDSRRPADPRAARCARAGHSGPWNRTCTARAPARGVPPPTGSAPGLFAGDREGRLGSGGRPPVAPRASAEGSSRGRRRGLPARAFRLGSGAELRPCPLLDFELTRPRDDGTLENPNG